MAIPDKIGKYAIGLYLFSGASAIQDRDEAGPMVGGGVSARMGYLQYALGVSYIHGVDTRPVIGFRTGGSLQLE